MDRFPLFVSLEGRRALVVGGGRIGLHRAEILSRFGADVTLIDPRYRQEISGIHRECRVFRPGDCRGFFLVVAATDSREVNQAVGREARESGIFVSVADCAQESTFYFPALCQGSGLTAGIVSDGTQHQKTAEAAVRIRRVLEEEI